jgi:hypothetical protein
MFVNPVQAFAPSRPRRTGDEGKAANDAGGGFRDIDADDEDPRYAAMRRTSEFMAQLRWDSADRGTPVALLLSGQSAVKTPTP